MTTRDQITAAGIAIPEGAHSVCSLSGTLVFATPTAELPHLTIEVALTFAQIEALRSLAGRGELPLA